MSKPYLNPNNLNRDEITYLKSLNLAKLHDPVDFHSIGIKWFDPELMPSTISPQQYRAYWARGLVAPNALPRFYPEDQHIRNQEWINENFYRLKNGGVHLLDNHTNWQSADKFDTADVRVCFVRLSEYEIVDGSIGQAIIANFITDYTSNMFFDFAYLPPFEDINKHTQAHIPVMMGNITKRPIRDFDFVLISFTVPEERLHLPLATLYGGIPLYQFQRNNPDLGYNAPLVVHAGMGAAFQENVLADHPVYGPGTRSLCDFVAMGEGEEMTLRYLQKFIEHKKNGGTKYNFIETLDNDLHPGVYDPRKVLFEYADKVTKFVDFEGKEVGEKTFKGAGGIKSISLIDNTNGTLHEIVGQHGEEFKTMEPMQARFIANFDTRIVSGDIGEQYVRVDKKLSLEERAKIFSARKDHAHSNFSAVSARADGLAEGVADLEAYVERRRLEWQAAQRAAGMAGREKAHLEVSDLQQQVTRNIDQQRVTDLLAEAERRRGTKRGLITHDPKDPVHAEEAKESIGGDPA